MANKCLQYVYPNSDLAKKYHINCENNKYFEGYNDLEVFNNKNFLKFIKDNYSDDTYNGDSPFTFKDNYINEENNELCDQSEFSLKPQQKFLGQIISPNTNIKNSLIFHGLGSGKTCTSLVIGEAFKDKTCKNLIYVVPAPLVNQYYEEIIGIIKNNKIVSCTAQCILKDEPEYYIILDELNELKEKYENDKDNDDLKNEIQKKEQKLQTKYPGDKSYSNVYKQAELNNLNTKLNKEKKELKEIDESDQKLFSQKQNIIKIIENDIKKTINEINSLVTKTFHIVSHGIFISGLFKITENKWVKGRYLNKGSQLLTGNCLLVIDEIQRLISEKGVLYKKLFTAIHQYFHNNLRILLLSATPIYDNPYELALTMNLLKPRLMFPLDKVDFFSFFLGEIDTKGNKNRVIGNNWIKENSCLINKELLNYMCSGYISYFKGGNPNAYPNKRIIELKHPMSNYQKNVYISALKSDLENDKTDYSKIYSSDEFVINELETPDDKITGIYVNSQQFSNIALQYNEQINIKKQKKNTGVFQNSLNQFKIELEKKRFTNSQQVLTYLRQKGYSTKFSSIIDLSLSCNGPVFIFSNFLSFGVKSLGYILEACGLTKYPNNDNGKGRYFIWSSESSINTELTSNAKKDFNSYNNKNGSILKIILGTRSVMEGVSFKNVKQVHLADPWWNEARIEQIAARAVRFCSHSGLPLEEQYTDIYKHYSVLPITPDPDISEYLKETFGRENHKEMATLGIEEKMVKSSYKKLKINLEFENVLKESSYDCALNQNGNIIRLEENIKNTTFTNYQITYKNPKTLQYYIRDSIPEEISYEDIQNRKYSFPNNTSFPLKFSLAKKENFKFIIDPEGHILDENNIDKNLNLYENNKCWDSELIFKNINIDSDIKKYLLRITNNYSSYIENSIIQLIKKNILLQKVKLNTISYNFDKQYIGKNKLSNCLNKLYKSDKTDTKDKKKIKKLMESSNVSQEKNIIIIDLIKKGIFDENQIEQLQLENIQDLKQILKELK